MPKNQVLMKSKLIAVFLLAATVFSCKDNNKEEAAKPEEKVETFDVTLNMVVTKDDNFQIFYTDQADPNFDEKKSVLVPVKASATAQDIVCHLPEDVIPTNLRVDLGNNAQQAPMKLNNFKISYFDKSYELKDTLILRNFVVNDQLKYDKPTSTLTPAQGKATIYDPFLYPQDNLKTEIEKIVK